jgi:hypothetical protein
LRLAAATEESAMNFNFWKARRTRVIEQMRDEILAAVRNGRSICESIDYAYLSKDDRQANTEPSTSSSG